MTSPIAWAVPWKCDITTVLGKPIDQWDKDINVAYLAESCASAGASAGLCPRFARAGAEKEVVNRFNMMLKVK